MPLITADRLRLIGVRLFEAAGVPAPTARLVVDSLVEANLTGHDSHGVIRLPQYLAAVRSGRIRPEARPEIVHETPTTALIDGHWGFGQVVARWAMARAVEKAEQEHVSAIGIYHCNHIGRLGEYALMAAQRGMISLVTCNTHSHVTPFGGIRASLGTNPVAWAVPAGRRAPFLLDFATSVVAEGKVHLARSRGVPVPPGWILDRNGLPATDPNALYEGGMLLPAGGYKGYALALLAELLGAILTGAGSPALGTYTGGNGTFMLVLDVAIFRPLAEFTAEVDALCDALHATPPAPGVETVLIPGEPELLAHARRERHGIEVDANTWAALQAIAQELGVALEVEEGW